MTNWLTRSRLNHRGGAVGKLSRHRSTYCDDDSLLEVAEHILQGGRHPCLPGDSDHGAAPLLYMDI